MSSDISSTVESRRTERHSRFVLLVAAGSAYVAVLIAWIALGFGGPAVTTAVDDIGELVIAAAAGVACLRRWRRSDPAESRFWLLFGLSELMWAAGETVWSVYEVGLGWQPFPSPADVGFLGAVPLTLAALLSVRVSPVRKIARLRAVVDGAVVVSALLFVSWATALGSVFHAASGTPLQQVLALAYPAGDLVIAAVVVWLIGYGGVHRRVVFGLVGAGVLAMAVADSAFAYLSTIGAYGIGSLGDTGWVIGSFLVCVAALWPTARARTTPAPARCDDDCDAAERGSGRWAILVPYVPAVLALLVVVFRWTRYGGFGPLLAVDGVVLMLMLGARQMLTVFENVSLSRKLAAKVELRARELERQDARFAALVRRSSNLTTILSATGVIGYQSPSAQRLLGRAPQDTVGMFLTDLLHPDDRSIWAVALTRVLGHPDVEVAVEWRLRRANGTTFEAESRIANLLEDPNVGGIVLNTRDISERKLLETELRHQAFHDALTGLANRALFRDRLEHALRRQRRAGGNAVGVLFLDLDEFKAVNDGLGHETGDHLLQAVGRRLIESVRGSDTVARLGGDEFAVLIEGLLPGSEPVETAERILSAFCKPFTLPGGDVFAYTSIGVATTDTWRAETGATSLPPTPAPATVADAASDLLRNADIALYAAKASGKGRWEAFHPGLHQQVIDRLSLKADLRRAVERDEFVVYYQPIVDAVSGRPDGAEALLRWQHPERGLVMPGDFIPAAEATGLIVPLSRWLLRRACADAQSWHYGDGVPAPGLSVNLSARNIDDPGLVEDVKAALTESGLDPRRLTLEITESAMMANPTKSVERLRELKKLDVRLAIDDFGTGHSSLSYLQQLPVDEIKIDRSFVIDVTEREESARLVRSIVRLAADFRLKTVVEGVETPAQLDELRRIGCRLVQGYIFARPMPLAALEGYLHGEGGSKVGVRDGPPRCCAGDDG